MYACIFICLFIYVFIKIILIILFICFNLFINFFIHQGYFSCFFSVIWLTEVDITQAETYPRLVKAAWSIYSSHHFRAPADAQYMQSESSRYVVSLTGGFYAAPTASTSLVVSKVLSHPPRPPAAPRACHLYISSSLACHSEKP